MMKSGSTELYVCHRCNEPVATRYRSSHDRICAYVDGLAKSVVEDFLAELELH